MILKGDAGDEHPGQELRQVAHQYKCGFLITPGNSLIPQHEQAQKSAPADGGVHKGADGGAGAVIKILKIVENGADIQHPLIPAGGIGMLGVDAGVIGEHEALVFKDNV